MVKKIKLSKIFSTSPQHLFGVVYDPNFVTSFQLSNKSKNINISEWSFFKDQLIRTVSFDLDDSNIPPFIARKFELSPYTCHSTQCCVVSKNIYIIQETIKIKGNFLADGFTMNIESKIEPIDDKCYYELNIILSYRKTKLFDSLIEKYLVFDVRKNFQKYIDLCHQKIESQN